MASRDKGAQQKSGHKAIGFIRLEPTIYRTGGEHANHYTTDMVRRRV
jgi:hypothetical protein